MLEGVTNTNKPNDTNLEPTALLLERLSTFGRFEKFVVVSTRDA